MKLKSYEQEFRNPKVFYPDPKNIDLDRVLVNLFMLLRCDGKRPVTRGRQKRVFDQVQHHVQALIKKKGEVHIAAEHEEIAKAWLESDIFDMVNRGTAKEAISSLRPLHLDAYKIRVASHCRDYNVADTLYAMLSSSEQQALRELTAYLGQGQGDGGAPLDLETLTVLKLVDSLPHHHGVGDSVAQHRPLCTGQGQVLCDDIQRLLAYRSVVPRTVMIDYLKTLCGLHVALFTLRLSRQLTGWLQDGAPHPSCVDCPVRGEHDQPFAGCPYPQSFVVDMGGDYKSPMAQLAQESAHLEYGRLLDLIKSVLAVNQLLRYAKLDRSVGGADAKVADVLPLLRGAAPGFEAEVRSWVNRLREENEGDDQKLTAEERAILDAGLPPFETWIELITHARQKHHLSYLTQFLDRLLQKNTDFGALVQGKTAKNLRRFHLGGRLLEVFVQLSVLRFDEGSRRYYTEPLLIDDFLAWVEARYGFVIAPARLPEGRRPVTVNEHAAFADNVKALKDRLREIGFYDDLSDAYNAQTLRPRYTLQRGSRP